MTENKKCTWNIIFKIFRKKVGQPAHYDQFDVAVNPDEYILDGIERIWAYHDRSLVFSHACHHSTCGACGMLVNGEEKLTCITTFRSVTRNGGTLRIEPLRNFPVISDLAVDMTGMFERMHAVSHRPIIADTFKTSRGRKKDREDLLRLADCIECGLCISACPISATSADYIGPAVLAGAQQPGTFGENVLNIVDSEDGAWRCHSAYECTRVCPSNVDPAWRIMDLRKKLVLTRVKRMMGIKEKA